MKKFFIVYGHYDDKSFNAAIRNTFINFADFSLIDAENKAK
jgi:NAD(P)H dehydrogenase (quinone)